MVRAGGPYIEATVLVQLVASSTTGLSTLYRMSSPFSLPPSCLSRLSIKATLKKKNLSSGSTEQIITLDFLLPICHVKVG